MSEAEETRDAGVPVVLHWKTDEALIDATRKAALSIRAKKEYGPRKRHPALVFRSSELGNIMAVRDAKGEPSGCALKTWYSFFADKYPGTGVSADTALNFDQGNTAEAMMRAYLEEAGLLVEEQVYLGAWTPCRGPCARTKVSPKAEPTCGVPAYLHEDPRYPDKSRGNVRGKCDFIIRHPEHGNIPLEWKSASTYTFGKLPKEGPKPENALQANEYGHELGTSHAALGYVMKESGKVLIFTFPVDSDLAERVYERCVWLRDLIVRGVKPPMPKGARGAERDPNRWKLPADAAFDRAWPCYTYGSQKKTVTACDFYEYCHGKLPKMPAPSEVKKRTTRRSRK